MADCQFTASTSINITIYWSQVIAFSTWLYKEINSWPQSIAPLPSMIHQRTHSYGAGAMVVGNKPPPLIYSSNFTSAMANFGMLFYVSIERCAIAETQWWLHLGTIHSSCCITTQWLVCAVVWWDHWSKCAKCRRITLFTYFFFLTNDWSVSDISLSSIGHYAVWGHGLPHAVLNSKDGCTFFWCTLPKCGGGVNWAQRRHWILPCLAVGVCWNICPTQSHRSWYKWTLEKVSCSENM